MRKSQLVFPGGRMFDSLMSSLKYFNQILKKNLCKLSRNKNFSCAFNCSQFSTFDINHAVDWNAGRLKIEQPQSIRLPLIIEISPKIIGQNPQKSLVFLNKSIHKPESLGDSNSRSNKVQEPFARLFTVA